MSRYVKKPRKTNANSRGRTVNKGNVRNKAGKVASNSKAKVNSKQKEGLIDRALTAFAKKLKKKNATAILRMSIPYVMFGYFGDKMAYAARITEEKEAINKLLGSLTNLGVSFQSLMPSFHPRDLFLGVVVGITMRLIVYFKGKNAKKFRKGVEYGSARWGTAKDIEPFIDDEDFDNNIILTETERLRMTGRPKDGRKERNRNVLVVGGSGSGKTRFFVKPNIMQLHSSYVVTDPKGTILPEVGNMLVKAGYVIKVINTINFKKSMHYNPMTYIHSEQDILEFVNALIINTKGEGQQSGEDFWVKAEKLLYQAYIGYMYYECTEEERNFETLIYMINESETREDDENFKNAIDLLFEDLAERKPNHFAVLQYRKYKLAAGKTAKSILISCGARLAPFDISELRDLTAYDEMELELVGDRKTALFMIMSDTDGTFNFLLALMEYQMFHFLCQRADDKYRGSLPFHVRFILDEFANIGQIPDFHRLIATIRSRNVSASIILQSMAQLKALYKDNARTIEINCDSKLFLGGSDHEGLKELVDTLGKETIDTMTTSDTRGNNPSYGVNYQKLGKELMTHDELAVMDRGKCILRLDGVRPFFSNKYDITKHRRYVQLADYDQKNWFDIQEYLEHRLVLKKNQTIEIHDLGMIEEEEPN